MPSIGCISTPTSVVGRIRSLTDVVLTAGDVITHWLDVAALQLSLGKHSSASIRAKSTSLD